MSLREGLVLDYIARHRKADRPGRSLPRRPAPKRRRARRALQLLARARAAGRAPGAGAVRSDARHPCAHRPRARMARIRRAPARHRRAHQLRAAPQALVLPDQERRPARLRAGRDRNHRARRAVSSARDAQARARRLRRAAGQAAARRSRRSPRSCGSPKASTAAIHRPWPASSSTTAATTAFCRSARSGDAELELWAAQRHAAPFERLIGKPLRVEVSKIPYVEQPDETARVPGKAVRRRGNRRLGKDDAAGPAGEVAERGRPSRVRHRMELVRPRQGGDQDGQEEERADPDDVQPAARHRLR